jgi:hypothetical protein
MYATVRFVPHPLSIRWLAPEYESVFLMKVSLISPTYRDSCMSLPAMLFQNVANAPLSLTLPSLQLRMFGLWYLVQHATEIAGRPRDEHSATSTLAM